MTCHDLSMQYRLHVVYLLKWMCTLIALQYYSCCRPRNGFEMLYSKSACVAVYADHVCLPRWQEQAAPLSGLLFGSYCITSWSVGGSVSCESHAVACALDLVVCQVTIAVITPRSCYSLQRSYIATSL